MIDRFAAALCFLFLAALPVPAQEEAPPGEAASWKQEVQRLYQKAKDSGEQVPGTVYEWARQDLQSAGDWEYRVVRLSDLDPPVIEGLLNELGRERWECFWVREDRKDVEFYLKRPRRSYIRSVPFLELLRLLPTDDGAAGGPATPE